MVKKYKALRIVGTIYKIIGAIILVGTIIGAAGSCISGILGGALFSGLADQLGSFSSSGSGGMALGGILIALVILLYGLIAGITTFALGEGVLFADRYRRKYSHNRGTLAKRRTLT